MESLYRTNIQVSRLGESDLREGINSKSFNLGLQPNVMVLKRRRTTRTLVTDLKRKLTAHTLVRDLKRKLTTRTLEVQVRGDSQAVGRFKDWFEDRAKAWNHRVTNGAVFPLGV
jgi:hypothetical protein